MGNIFNTVKMATVPSNTFDLSYDMKLSLDMGKLVPIHCQEVVPGDRISMRTESLLRFSPLIAPVMHKVDVYQHFFFVPNRLVWSGWEDFITGKSNQPAFPYFEDMPVITGSLADYLGLPITEDIGVDKVSALPFAAYQRIYNEYYRDQNLSEERPADLVDGLNPYASFNHLRNRAWEHDYFTSALPFAQKGEAVELPIAQFEDVNVRFDLDAWQSQSSDPYLKKRDGTLPSSGDLYSNSGGNINAQGSTSGPIVAYDPQGTLKAETSELGGGASTINDLRKAFRLQEFLEKAARGGTRYIEQIKAHFGITSSDARLNRPEYLGGSKQPVVISEVLQTAPDEIQATAVGTMAGHGISVGSGKQFSYRAEEHGYIIGIISIVPKTAYSQGIPKHFSKFDRLQFYWPSFANLGEQEILNRELYYNEHEAEPNDAVFGYTPRYAEYKYHDSRVAGDFRNTLSFWHLGRTFSSRPNLNQNFIECDPGKRIFAVASPTQHSIYAHVFHRCTARRLMPKYGTPTF